LSDDEGLKALERVAEILRDISSCRNSYLAKALSSLTLSLGGTLTALTAALFPSVFVSDYKVGSALLMTLLLFFSIIMFYTFKKTFKYTFKIASLREGDSRAPDFLLFPVMAAVTLAAPVWPGLPYATMAIPFFLISLIKILMMRREKAVSGVVLASLSMLSVATNPIVIPVTLSISYSVSTLFEVLINLEEAEKCVENKGYGHNKGISK